MFGHCLGHFLKLRLQRFNFAVVLGGKRVLPLLGFGQLELQLKYFPFYVLLWVRVGLRRLLIDYIVLGCLLLPVDKFSNFILKGLLVWLENCNFVVELFYLNLQIVYPIYGVHKLHLLTLYSGLEFLNINLIFRNLVVSSFCLLFVKADLLS